MAFTSTLAMCCGSPHPRAMTSAYLQLDSLAVHAGREDLTELGVHALPIDLSSTNPLPDIAAAVRPDTAMIVLETPANPTLELVDIRAVVEAAQGVPVLVDNTFATPVLQNPVDLGAAMVLHSATKYLGGHGDVIAGVIA